MQVLSEKLNKNKTEKWSWQSYPESIAYIFKYLVKSAISYAHIESWG